MPSVFNKFPIFLTGLSCVFKLQMFVDEIFIKNIIFYLKVYSHTFGMNYRVFKILF